MLIVVGILVVLLGVGFVALMNHMRNLHQKEMDGQAKEIFVAAQNHLSMAYSQGYLGKIAFKDVNGVETSTGDFGTAEDAEKGIFYFITTGVSAFGSDTVLDQMLPVASVDETARTGGSYIIRYQKEPARVLDVFYVSTSGRYSHTFSSDEYNLMMELRDEGSESHRNERNKYDFPPTADGVKGDQGVVIGYYGGEAPAEIPNGFELEAPIVEIENNERLKIKVTNTNKKLSDAPSGESNTEKYQNTLTLVIAHTNESQPVTIKLIDNGAPLELLAKYDLKYDSTKDQFTLTLDDITAKNMHFAEVMGENYTPGENILVFASASNTNVWTNVADSGRQITNSLFASRSGDTVHIANFRHFLNLDRNVSGLTLTNMVAEQDGDMSWYDAENDKSFLTKTGAKGVILKDRDSLATAEYCLYPIRHDNLTYHGNGHVISDVKVNTSGAAGLFSALDFSTVSNVELLNFDVESTGSHAGALAGSATSSDISGVLVRNDPLKEKENELEITASGSSGSVGGMVGHMTNGSVERCAAAVYVNSTGSAGGLIGTVVSSVLADTEPSERKTVSIKNSYSGGHTNELEYTELTSGTNAGRINVIAAKKAGGLIGDSSDAKLNLDYCYSTSSASGEEATGGLIGVAGAGQVRHSYAVGLVINGGSGDSMKRGAFVGDKGSLDLLDTGENPQQTNAYLEGLSKDASQSNLIALAKTSADMVNTNQLFSTSPMEAMTYDQKLSSRFSFRTIKELHDYFEETSSSFEANYFTEAHYGDWQLPTMEILHYTLVNSDQLYSVIDLGSQTTVVSVGVKGEKSRQARVYVLSVDRNNKTVTAQTSYCVDVNGNSIIGASKNDELWLPCKVDEKAGNLQLTVYLDDVKQTIRGKNGHFGYLFASNTGTYEDNNLLPGENITLLVGGGSCSWAELTTLLTKKYPADAAHADKNKIIALSDNSLFAKTAGLAAAEDRTLEKPYENTDYASELAKIADAEIKLLRHLQNLDTDTSGVNASEDLADDKQVKTAKQTGHISWIDQEIWNLAGSGSVNCFNGIYNQFLTEYDGDYWSIIDLPIEATSTEYSSSNNSDTGLFRYIRAARIIDDGDPDTVDVSDGYTMTIKNLRLKDVTVTGASGGSAGAVVGMNEGVLELNTVLADGSADYGVSGADNSGGLVGLSNKTLTITNSASALLVSGTANAGGLLGYQEKKTGVTSSVIILNSYVGGHTTSKKYYTGTASDGTDGRWNIISSGAAGGLIGATDASAYTGIENSFNAASVFGAANSAGGIIGVAGGSFKAVPVSEGGADGTSILNLVYTIAPVNSVKSLTASGEGTEANPWSFTANTEATGTGDVFGLASALSSGKLYFLPSVYNDTVNYPGSDYPNGVSSIQAVGSIGGDPESYNTTALTAILQTVKPIARALTSDDSVDTDVLGINNPAHMVLTTEVFDSNIGASYPYAIWTHFEFRNTNGTKPTGSGILYYRGDWQPISQVTAVHLVAHFVSVVPDETNPSLVKYYTPEETEEFTILVPYEPKSLIIPYAQSIVGYTLGDHWNLFNGNFGISADTATMPTSWNGNNIGGGTYATSESEADASNGEKQYSEYYLSGAFGMGQVVTLDADIFAQINDEANYKDKDGNTWLETSGTDPYVHVTFVSQYDADTSEYYQINFHDYDFDTGTYSEDPCATMVLEATDKKNLPDTLAELWALGKNDENKAPSRYVVDQRFLGWSANQNKDDHTKLVFKNTLQSDESYLLVADTGVMGGISVKNDGKPINVIELYAQYKPIVMSYLEITFKDANENDLALLENEDERLPHIKIAFESDRGFDKNITLYAWSVPDSLKPAIDKETHPTEYALYESYIEDPQLNYMPPSATFKIPAKDDLTTPVTYEYVLKYKDMEGGGYAILFELLHTAGDYDSSYNTYKYDSSSSVILGRFASTSGVDSRLYGAVERGEPLVVDPSTLTGILTKLCGNNKTHFEFTTYGSGANEAAYALIELDDNGEVPNTEEYAAYTSLKKGVAYPATVPDPDDSSKTKDIRYLVVMQCARQTYELSYDSDGGTNISTELVEYGRPLEDFLTMEALATDTSRKPTRKDFEFQGWQAWDMTGDDVIVPVSDPNLEHRMPAQNKTVTAKWKGGPTQFTVSFWFENANDADYSFVYSFVIDQKDSDTDAYYKTKVAGQTITAKWFMDKFGDTGFKGRDNEHFYYDSDLNKNKEEITLEPGGITLLKVFFTRKEKTIEFYRRGEWKPDSSTNNGPYYGYVSSKGDWVELTSVSIDPTWYSDCEYEQTTENSSSVQYYGLKQGEYWPVIFLEYAITAEDDHSKTYFGKIFDGYYVTIQWGSYGYGNTGWYYNGMYGKTGYSGAHYLKLDDWRYLNTSSATTNGVYYIEDDNGNIIEQQLYYKSDNTGRGWYKNYNQYSWSNPYTNPYSGPVYTLSSESPDKRFKQIDGKKWEEDDLLSRGNWTSTGYQYSSFSGTGDVAYAEDTNTGDDSTHGHVIVSKVSTQWTYTLKKNGVESAPIVYTGTRYKWEDSSSSYGGYDPYDPGGFGPGGFGPGGFGPGGGGPGGFDPYDPSSWFDNNSNVYHRWTGKWKSTFDSNGYDWQSMVKEGNTYFQWNEYDYSDSQGAGTTQTYLEAFGELDYDTDSEFTSDQVYALYGTKMDSVQGYIYHYQQNKDGKTYTNDPVIAFSSSVGGTFNFSNKFSQFVADSYTGSTSSGGYNSQVIPAPFNANGGEKKITATLQDDGTYTFSPSSTAYYDKKYYPLHVYHARKSYKLTFYNGGTEIFATGKSESDPTKLLYDVALNEIDFSDVPVKPSASDCPYEGGGFTFRGWALSPVDDEEGWKTINLGEGVTKEPDNWMDYNMPEDGVVLYAKWTRDPLEVSFTIDESKAKFYKDGELQTVDTTIDWPNPAPTVTSFSKDNDPKNPVPYGKNIADVVAGEDGKLSDTYKPVCEDKNYVFSHWAYMGIVYNDDGTPKTDNGGKVVKEERTFLVSAAITEDMELYPVFVEKAIEQITVKIYHKLPDGTEQYADTRTVTYGKTAYFKISKLSGSDYVDYELDPPYFFGVINERFLQENHYDPDTNECKYVFKYVNRKAAWGYTVEYCLDLENVSTHEKTLIPIATETVSGLKSEFVFRAFYALPDTMGGYEFEKLVFPEKEGDERESTDPVVLIRRDEITKLQVVIKPVISAIIRDEVVEQYTGKEHDIAALFNSRLPKIGNDLQTNSGTVGTLTVGPYEFTVTCRYAVGSAEATDIKPVNAGIYRLDIQIKLTMTDGSGNEYILWKTNDFDPTDHTRPDIVLTIQPRTVYLTSDTLDKIFVVNDTNNPASPKGPYFDANGNLTSEGKDAGYPYVDDATDLLNNARMLDVAKSDIDTTFVHPRIDKLYGETDADIEEIESLLNDPDNVVIGLLPESFRRMASTEDPNGKGYTYTPNAFTFEVRNINTNNFNFYKEYGKIYYWDSLGDYNAYKTPTTSTGGGSGSGGEGGE